MKTALKAGLENITLAVVQFPEHVNLILLNFIRGEKY
jgi:hypothetical protein